jgi:molybdate transport system substrate-binding protein
MTRLRVSRILACTAVAILLVLACFSGCTGSQTQTEQKKVIVYSGAGLKKPLDTVIEQYQNETGVNVTVNYGGSGGLYAQIEQGQPADLFFSADWKFIDKLINASKVTESKKFLREYVVLVTSPTGDQKGITSAQDISRDNVVVVVSDPSAPIGTYTEKVLRSLDVWNLTTQKGNIKARPGTVNQVALMVQNDEADAGFIFSSTAKLYDLPVKEKYPQTLSGDIIFGLAVMKGQNEEAAKDFMDYIIAHDSEFTKYGWEPYA